MPTTTFTGETHYITTKREWNGLTRGAQLAELEELHAEALLLNEATVCATCGGEVRISNIVAPGELLHVGVMPVRHEAIPAPAPVDRAAQVEASKAQCRAIIANLEAYQPGRFMAMYIWIDGAFGDYWYVARDDLPVGEILFDSFGPVVKGDELSTLVYRAELAAEKAGR